MTTRRTFIKQSAASGVAACGVTGAGLTRAALGGETPHPVGKAEQVIFVWLGGGAAQIDTFDPKRRGDPKTGKPGSDYAAIDTAIEGTQVCEHLPRCAKILDRFNIVRTVHHEGFPDHAAATNFVHTGRPTSGTILYPSIGSLVSHTRGPINENLPAYVLIGMPSVARGPGFLGPTAGYIYMTDTEKGPSSFTREAGLSTARQMRREQLLSQMRSQYLGQQERAQAIQDYDQAIDESLRLSGPEFQRVFQLDEEPDSLRTTYGGEFGQRCLLSRRLLQSGVRFVEVSHNINFVNGTGWDTHREGQLKQHLMIEELDIAMSALVSDLEQNKMLDKTLIVIGTEFGRPPGFDGKGGRGHQATAFSMVFAGGGLRNGITIGETDEFAKTIVDRPVSVADFHATIACAVGIDPATELYAGERPVPLTDHGQPIRELFA
ncbi:MAG: DUF1501 domain-containing protein [Pirellulaceae bacterium]